MKKILIPLAILMTTVACSFISFPFGGVTPSPETPPTPTVTITVRFAEQGLFCSTDSEEARTAYNTAIAFQEQGRFEDARDAYLSAIELDPGYCDAMDNLGLLYRRHGDVDEAIYWYQRSIEIFPENPIAHQNLGLAYQVQERYPDALSEYLLLIEIDPENPEGYFGAGQTYLNLDNPEDAIPMLETADMLYTSGDYPEEYSQDTRYLLGVAYYFVEKYEQARDSLEPLYPLLEDDAWVNYMLGMCYLTEPIYNLEKARTYVLRARDLGLEIPADVLEAVGE